MKVQQKENTYFESVLQFGLLLFITLASLVVLRNFVGTEFKTLRENMSRKEMFQIKRVLESEHIPYTLSYNYKKVKIPDYELDRVEKLLSHFSLPRHSENALGGY